MHCQSARSAGVENMALTSAVCEVPATKYAPIAKASATKRLVAVENARRARAAHAAVECTASQIIEVDCIT